MSNIWVHAWMIWMIPNVHRRAYIFASHPDIIKGPSVQSVHPFIYTINRSRYQLPTHMHAYYLTYLSICLCISVPINSILPNIFLLNASFPPSIFPFMFLPCVYFSDFLCPSGESSYPFLPHLPSQALAETLPTHLADYISANLCG